MPLDAEAGAAIGKALDSRAVTVVNELCRRDVGQYLNAIDGVDDTVVGCTQERALFAEIAQNKNSVAPLRFVNLRETGGWGQQAGSSLPKMAALLAAAALPAPEPVPTVEYSSAGQVLIIGPSNRALAWAKRLGAELDVSVLLTGTHPDDMLMDRNFPIFSGSAIAVEGWLGAFKVTWRQANPIDLEVCTRCNACIDVCPENAIDLAYQIDMDKCTSHRDCMRACAAIGAIDFNRSDDSRDGEYDLVFDLSDAPLLSLHQPPQGYFAPGADPVRQMDDSLKLVNLVGKFDKPKFFIYKDKICAHGRNEKIGCNACVEVCSAEAISHHGNHVKVNPNLCVGCGACTTVCPSGAMGYAYPRPSDMGRRIKAMLAAYAKAGGTQPAILLHNGEEGAELIAKLGRLAKIDRRFKGFPSRVMPVEMHHIASAGIDLWLSAAAYGAANIAILSTGAEAPQYIEALEAQRDIAQRILAGLGYEGVHIHLLRAPSVAALDAGLHAIQAAQVPAVAATFQIGQEKRSTLDFALAHLLKHAPAPQQEIALPPKSPYGRVNVDTSACTLCMSCVGACPQSALLDNPNAPQLRFLEKNCVQCGLCEKTCPENAITLTPRLLLTDAAKQPVVLNEAQPFHCIRCSKPFGTLQMIENMLSKLSLHGAFAGNLDRLKMCADCRVIDMMENPREMTINDLKRH